ncbi:MAG: M48 family metallopeptidase [Methanobacterium sp.]|nr:M48 family metallopeptidase [Methanobacterium sp.]
MIKKVKIQDMEVEYEVFHRKVKYTRLEIKTDKLRIIMPLNYNKDEEIIKKHEKWIYKKLNNIKRSEKEADNKELNYLLTETEFRDIVLLYIENLSNNLDVKVNKIYFKWMKTRWGSCSSKKNININNYLIYLPTYLIEYVIFHELTHLVEMKHNNKFWSIIAGKYPNYKKMEHELLIYWLLIRKNFALEQ